MLASAFDGLDDLVYIADLETYELLYANRACLQSFHLQDSAGCKCYEVLQGLNQPCDFCTNQKLREHGRWAWHCFNPLLQRHFDLHDSIIDFRGRRARLEIVYDVTRHVGAKRSAQHGDIEQLIAHCARLLNDDDGNRHTQLNLVLEEIGCFLEAERCYIFEIQGETASNTHEWCRAGVTPQQKRLQHVPQAAYARWLAPLLSGSSVFLPDIEDIASTSPVEYAYLKPQGIRSLLVEPLTVSGSLFGFLGVDNPASDRVQEARITLASISKFMGATIERFRLISTLAHYSHHDALTGLGNRHLFRQKLESLGGPGAAILLLEVNGLKKINEQYGMPYGDELLTRIGDMLGKLGGNGRTFRLSGGEFAILWADIAQADFLDKQQRLQSFFSGILGFSAAVGGHWLAEGDSPGQAYTRAEKQMYRQKQEYYRQQGGSRYRAEMDDMLRLAQPGTLEQMLDDGKVVTYWQPKYSLKDGRICGAEALVRLHHGGEVLAPGQFMPLLESLHRTYLLDYFVFEEVCRFLRHRLDAGLPVVPVSSNFSRHTFIMPDFLDRLEAIRRRHAVPLPLLQVEITETVDAADHAAFQSMARRLHTHGFCLAIDDFGVAHANLATLAEVDFSVLKLDKRLIHSLESNPRLLKILEMLILTSHALRINTVAEGVERHEQLDILSGMGCHEVQGFLFSRPLPLEEFQKKLDTAAPC